MVGLAQKPNLLPMVNEDISCLLQVLIALKEKGVSYESTVVGLTTSGTYAPWFLKLNPKGQVPVLKIGDKVVPDSEAIIDVIDGLPCRNGN